MKTKSTLNGGVTGGSIPFDSNLIEFANSIDVKICGPGINKKYATVIPGELIAMYVNSADEDPNVLIEQVVTTLEEEIGAHFQEVEGFEIEKLPQVAQQAISNFRGRAIMLVSPEAEA